MASIFNNESSVKHTYIAYQTLDFHESLWYTSKKQQITTFLEFLNKNQNIYYHIYPNNYTVVELDFDLQLPFVHPANSFLTSTS